MLSGPADYTRPANPWPRLLAFAAVVLGAFALAGLCFVSFADTPDREIRVRDTEFQPGFARFLPVQAFGSDADLNTYGAFLAVPADAGSGGQGARAFLSRSPDTNCNLRWEGATHYEGVTGVFVDPCSEARFAFDGVALHPGAARDLHRLDVRREANSYVVSFEVLTLGLCRDAHTPEDGACSPAGAPVTRTVPKTELGEDFGNR
jgi:hypothetical protein